VRGRARSLSCRNKHHLNKLNKLLAAGYNWLDISIYLVTDIEDELVAYDLEKKYISLHNNEKLLNICEGGKGGRSGCKKKIYENEFLYYLERNVLLKNIALKLNCSKSLLKKRFYKNESLVEYCKRKSIKKNNHMAKNISQQKYLALLREGKSNKEIAKILKVNINFLKSNFYPGITLKKFCKNNNIAYFNTQQNTKNGNYKQFPVKLFTTLVKEGANLTKIATELQLSKRCIIHKYREAFNVTSWKELLKVLSD
jgi:hypothetical protein